MGIPFAIIIVALTMMIVFAVAAIVLYKKRAALFQSNTPPIHLRKEDETL